MDPRERAPSLKVWARSMTTARLSEAEMVASRSTVPAIPSSATRRAVAKGPASVGAAAGTSKAVPSATFAQASPLCQIQHAGQHVWNTATSKMFTLASGWTGAMADTTRI